MNSARADVGSVVIEVQQVVLLHEIDFGHIGVGNEPQQRFQSLRLIIEVGKEIHQAS